MTELSIHITEKGGETRILQFEENQVTIGRVDANDIVLPKGNISKRHSKIVAQDGKVVIVDLKSTNGTYVNGDKISGPTVLADEDKVYIGDFTIQVKPEVAEAEPSPEPEPEEEILPDLDDDILLEEEIEIDDDAELENFEDLLDDEEILIDDDVEEPLTPPPRKPEPKKEPAEKPPRRPKMSSPAIPAKRSSPESATKLLAGQSIFVRAYRKVSEGNEFPGESDKPEVQKSVQETISELKKEGRFSSADLKIKPEKVVDEICGFGALKSLLDDTNLDTIFINGPERVFVNEIGNPDRNQVDVTFSSPEALSHIVRRFLKDEECQFDAEHPLVDIRLPDGTHINAAHSSVCADGPSITIARQIHKTAELSDLVTLEVLSKGMASFLETCVENRRNIIVCGAARNGMATLMSALGQSISNDQRVIHVQRGNQPQSHQDQGVVLQPRNAQEARELVCHGIQMQPDRLIVHEMISSECMEVVLAMSGGQNGTIASLFASSASSCLERMETMVMSTGYDLPARFVRQQLATSIDVVVCVNHYADGTYKVTEILEVTGSEVEIVRTQDLFVLQIDGFGEDGAVQGRFQAKGNKPRFYSQLARQGVSLDMAIFREGI
jgi:pilus assembly protein CpaF